MIVKCVLDTQRKKNDGSYPVKLRLTHEGSRSFYALGIDGKLEDFDSRTGLFYTDKRKTLSKHTKYNKIIMMHIDKCDDIIRDRVKDHLPISSIIVRDLLVPDTVFLKDEDFAEEEDEVVTLQQCFDAVIKTKTGRTNGAYRTTLKWITHFYGDKVPACSVNEEWLDNFDSRLEETKDNVKKNAREDYGLSINARASHLKNLRAVFNHAIKRKMIPQDNYPFRYYEIKTEETIKRSMPEDDIRKLFNYKTEDSKEEMTIDICKMIFFSCGTSIKDLYLLTDFKESTMCYKRSKTSRLYNIYIHEELRVLFNKYEHKDSGLTLPHMYSLDWLNRMVNNLLEYICLKIGIKTITTYSMRHSWATYASRLGVSRDDIRAALGHGSKTMTDVYIDYDMERVKKANRQVIDYVLYPDKYNDKYQQQ